MINPAYCATLPTPADCASLIRLRLLRLRLRETRQTADAACLGADQVGPAAAGAAALIVRQQRNRRRVGAEGGELQQVDAAAHDLERRPFRVAPGAGAEVGREPRRP